MKIKTHEVGGEGPAAKAEREAKEKAAAAEQAAAEAAAKAEAKEDTRPAVTRGRH
jgi:membrane protein involved in colicin uptake